MTVRAARLADGSLGLEVPAELREIEEVCHLARRHLEASGAEKESFCLLLGLREALSNAILHGSGQNPAKTVQVVVRATVRDGTGLVEMDVQDQGPGFDWRHRALEPPAPEATGGRGLPILHSCFDSLDFNAAGNRITLRKRLKRDADMTDITRQGATARLAPKRDIVAAMVQDFKDELKVLVEEGVKHLVIDFTGVEMVDSIGIGLLIATHNSLKAKGGGLALEAVNADIASLFKTMRLDKHFNVATA